MLFTWSTRGTSDSSAVSFSSAFDSFFVLLFGFFAILSFVATTPDKFQFQSQVRLSQINVKVPIRLKFKL